MHKHRGRAIPSPGPLHVVAAVVATVALAMAAAGPAAATGPVTTGPVATPVVLDALFRLPFAPGLEVTVSQGWHGTYSHVGLAKYAYDFALPAGSAVLASAAGRVAFAHTGESSCGGTRAVGRANYVTLYHADGTATHYGHLSEVAVAVGDEVLAGEPIGLVGDTGFTNCQDHLHFSRQEQGAAVTQSLPIYFVEYPDQQLRSGDVVSAAWLEVALVHGVDLVAAERRFETIRVMEASGLIGIYAFGDRGGARPPIDTSGALAEP